VRAHDGSINDHVFVVVFTRQQLENTLENSTLRKAPPEAYAPHDVSFSAPPVNAGRTPITLRQGARVIDDSRRLRMA
jgi:hypothetical protein